MHGIIHLELQRYATATLGRPASTDLARSAGVGGTTYLASRTYPDAEAVAILTALAAQRAVPIDDVLQEFGTFLVPDLLATYAPYLRPEWRTIDVLVETEDKIHKAVRLNTPGALPPQLQVTRDGPNAAVLVYRSPRQMCGLAKGIAAGIAAHFGEPLSVHEASCMALGASECRVRFEVPPVAAG